MNRKVIRYKGRYGEYYIRERANENNTSWVWEWGYIVERKDGSIHYAPMGQGDKKPLPFKVFHNLIINR